jgi:undecaprenyl diphosphate synthase
MKIFDRGIKDALIDLEKKNMRFIHLGRRDRIPGFLKKTIEDAEEKTKNYGPKIFCIALDYSGKDQEIRMMKKVQKLPKNTDIDSNLVIKLRDSGGIVNPADLIIRTSGEQRTSDLGWLVENSEFYSIKGMLPETQVDDFINALVDYSKRERRFGGRTK